MVAADEEYPLELPDIYIYYILRAWRIAATADASAIRENSSMMSPVGLKQRNSGPEAMLTVEKTPFERLM